MERRISVLSVKAIMSYLGFKKKDIMFYYCNMTSHNILSK